MKNIGFGYENRMIKRLESVSILLLVSQIALVIAVFAWPRLMVCIGVPQVVYGILHWVAAVRSGMLSIPSTWVEWRILAANVIF